MSLVKLEYFKALTNEARKGIWNKYPQKAKRYNRISGMCELLILNRDGIQIFIPFDYCSPKRLTNPELAELRRMI